ncbi:MAG: M20/M25/M40 family metallo-hydrolase [Gemmatimonadaceae bacterium]
MLSDASLSFLTRLLDTPGPSGFEAAAARAWREEASDFAASVAGDVHGNSIAVANPNGAPTIMLAGHIDEIGLIVTYIDEQGFVYVSPIGGWDPQVLVAQRIRFQGVAGDVYGVVGKKPIHLIKQEEREKAAKLPELWIDIGANSRDAAQQMLRIGDPGVIDARLLRLPNNRIASRSIDDRIGAFVVLEALRRYAENPGAARVVAVATTQEEIGYLGGGALPGATRVNPAMAIVVDVTFATDSPGIDKKEVGECALGGGPAFARGSVISPVVFGLLIDAARRLNVPHTVRAVGRNTSTDADAIHIAREGVATALVGVPNRYMHSPNEMVSLDDVDRTADVIAETCRTVTPSTDFTAR